MEAIAEWKEIKQLQNFLGHVILFLDFTFVRKNKTVEDN